MSKSRIVSRGGTSGTRVLAALALTVLLAACGAGEGETTGAGTEDDASSVDSDEDPATDEGWPEEIVFAGVPSEDVSDMSTVWEPMLRLLEDELGISIEFFLASDFGGVIEGQIAQRVDMAMYGPFGYHIALANGADIEPIVAILDDPDSEASYQSYAIAHIDSDIESLEDLAGRDVCFVDPGSTGGYLWPSAGLLEVGIDPETDVNGIFAGGHDASVLSVVNQDCEAGFAFDEMVDTVMPREQGLSEGEDFKIIWKSSGIPNTPIAVGSWLPADLRSAIQETLTAHTAASMYEAGYCDESAYESENGEMLCPIAAQRAYGFQAADQEFYEPITEVCELTQADACLPEE